jgi:hypothetical protein
MSAILSECRKYRYALARGTNVTSPHPESILFIMLNPSKADEIYNDPTIIRCKGFVKRWKSPGLIVGNLYALRSKYPKALWKANDPVGPANDDYLELLIKKVKFIVCAWGTNAKKDRIKTFLRLANKCGVRLYCLGITKDGHPRHPLFVKKDQKLIQWFPNV